MNLDSFSFSLIKFKHNKQITSSFSLIDKFTSGKKGSYLHLLMLKKFKNQKTDN